MKFVIASMSIFGVLACSRLIPHPPNFTSLLALSFYVPVFLGLSYLPVLLIGFVFASVTIWNAELRFLQSFSWIIGAVFSSITYYLLASK